MKGFPLQTLIHVRARRLETAQAHLAEQRRIVHGCRQVLEGVQARIEATASERRQRQRDMLNRVDLNHWQRCEQRLALLEERAQLEQRDLESAQQAVAEAEQALAQASDLVRRAHLKNEAVLEQQRVWRVGEQALAARIEEQAMEEVYVRRVSITG